MRKSKFSEVQIATTLKEAALDTQHSQIWACLGHRPVRLTLPVWFW